MSVTEVSAIVLAQIRAHDLRALTDEQLVYRLLHFDVDMTYAQLAYAKVEASALMMVAAERILRERVE